MGIDLGTYYVRVEMGHHGFILEWNTGARYTGGIADLSPLNAMRIHPPYYSQEEVLRAIKYMFLQGNFSCDCNKRLFLDRLDGCEQDKKDAEQCGSAMKIMRLVVICPDGKEEILI